MIGVEAEKTLEDSMCSYSSLQGGGHLGNTTIHRGRYLSSEPTATCRHSVSTRKFSWFSKLTGKK